MHNFYFNREIPTLDTISNVLKIDETLPNVGRKKLWQILHQLNFSWENTTESQYYWIDKIVFFGDGSTYLRNIARYKNEKRKFFINH